MIRTVLGDIGADTLGHAQCHEHLFIQDGVSARYNPDLRMDDLEKTQRELMSYREAGGDLVVDAQPVFCGRMAESLAKVSKATDVSIVAVTGFHKLLFYEESNPIYCRSENELTRLFISEINEGMLGDEGKVCAARAGMIKCALDACGRNAGRYPILFQAVSNAALETGVPILVHTERDTDVCELLSYFQQNGITADRVILCHMDRMHKDIGVHKQAVSMGAYVCYDSVHRHKYLSDYEEMELIHSMVEARFAHRVLLSLDTTAARLRAYKATDMGLDYILKEFIPMLRQNGFTEEDIDLMTGKNARSALCVHDKGEEAIWI